MFLLRMPPVRVTLRNANVGLTENPAALRRWMVSGPEMARIIGEFEVSTKKIENRFLASPADETCTYDIRTRYHVIN